VDALRLRVMLPTSVLATQEKPGADGTGVEIWVSPTPVGGLCGEARGYTRLGFKDEFNRIQEALRALTLLLGRKHSLD
jgi:hypothetical protein